MSLRLLLPVIMATAMASGASADEAVLSIDQTRSKARQLAFDPARFFPERHVRPHITIRYTGDDYGYPVYSIAVRRGCTNEDKGEARKSCGDRLTARMVRSPRIETQNGKEPRPRWNGASVFGYLQDRAPSDEASLRTALDEYGLEWLEADVRRCPSAMAYLSTEVQPSFFADPIVPDPNALSIVLHADKILLEFGGYITHSRYFGYAKEGSPGEWAVRFAQSLEDCWQPTKATPPWLLEKPPVAEID